MSYRSRRCPVKRMAAFHPVQAISVLLLLSMTCCPGLHVCCADARQAVSGNLLKAGNFQYLGAFRLPGGDNRPRTFAYGGGAMTFNPRGDPAGGNDGFPGSLFIMGHVRLPYGEMPDGNQVAEVSIPVPVRSKSVSGLKQAKFIQGFQDIARGRFKGYDEIPRNAMQYLDTKATGPKIHLAWGQHMEPERPAPTHAWFDLNLRSPNFQGDWYIGNRSFYSVNGYMFEVPASFADRYLEGRYLATGRYRDGGWSGMGPALFAYRPWVDEKGTPARPGTRLREKVLLMYKSSQDTSRIEQALNGYQHPDEWQGGAWITTGSGRSAVLFAGTKSTGRKYWYGYTNPAGPEYPCIDTEFLGQFDLCRLADGTVCPKSDLKGCKGHNDYRGWWSTRFDAQFILYDPSELAQVAQGRKQPWQPQPYAVISIDEHLFLNPAGIEREMIGSGAQRRFRLGATAYDRENGLLYVLELFADGAKPIVHVWRIR